MHHLFTGATIQILPQLLARLTAYLNLQPTMLHYNGKLFVVEVDRIRIRE